MLKTQQATFSMGHYLVTSIDQKSRFIAAIVCEESPEEAIRLLRNTYAYKEMVRNDELQAELIRLDYSAGVHYAVVRKSYN